MITKITPLPTWFQRHISPLVTRISSITFQNREAVARGIREIARTLDSKEKFALRLALNNLNLLLPKYRNINLSEIHHYHLCKSITTTKLALAAYDFYQNTGRDDFLMVIPQIVRKKVSERINLQPGKINYQIVLSTIKPRLLAELKRREKTTEQWRSATIDSAFELACRISRTEKEVLLYRIKKMAEIGGDTQSIIASLFMDLPAAKVANILEHSHSDGLRNLATPIAKIIKKYQFLIKNFHFDISQISKDKLYLCRMMSWLIKTSENPRVLLLFFLNKLMEARRQEQSSSQISYEIRFLLAPLAERLSLIFLADDLRDQFLRIRNATKYSFIVEKVKNKIGMDYERAKIYLRNFCQNLFHFLQNKLGIEAQDLNIKFRVKSPYSIWNKVEIRREYAYENLPDILGIKVICESNEQILKVFEELKKAEFFKIQPDSVKKDLENPQDGKWKGIKMLIKDNLEILSEIQIMTWDMNNENNRGKAAHWRYNLEKELGKIEQIFIPVEPKEILGPNYFENFYQLLDFWTMSQEINPLNDGSGTNPAV